jgi:hypothetical protein
MLDALFSSVLLLCAKCCVKHCSLPPPGVQSALAKERRELQQQQQRTLLEAIPKDLSRPWEDPMPDEGERHLAAVGEGRVPVASRQCDYVNQSNPSSQGNDCGSASAVAFPAQGTATGPFQIVCCSCAAHGAVLSTWCNPAQDLASSCAGMSWPCLLNCPPSAISSFCFAPVCFRFPFFVSF